jgi:hypothetical protein
MSLSVKDLGAIVEILGRVHDLTPAPGDQFCDNVECHYGDVVCEITDEHDVERLADRVRGAYYDAIRREAE